MLAFVFLFFFHYLLLVLPLSRYVPIVPLVLINGAQGIGTGFSTDIPLYNPLDVIANIR